MPEFKDLKFMNLFKFTLNLFTETISEKLRIQCIAEAQVQYGYLIFT